MLEVRTLSEHYGGLLISLYPGLPKAMKLKLLEPLRELFKDGTIFNCGHLDVLLANHFSEGNNLKIDYIDY